MSKLYNWKCVKTWHYSVANITFWLCLLVSTVVVANNNCSKEHFDINLASDDDLKERLKDFGVHYTLKSVIDVFTHPKNRMDETVCALLLKFDELRRKTPMNLPHTSKRHLIISIDGFFTHGRTKIAKMVATALHGRRILMPTKHVRVLRSLFLDNQMRKHYYSLNKYMGAYLARIHCLSAPVILERYWHDQTAYVIAKTFGSLVRDNSSIFKFPEDLLIPDVMFFINGALEQGIHNYTSVALYKHSPLSQSVLDLYRKMREPSLTEIGPPGLPLPMVHKILKKVRSLGHLFLPKPLRMPYWRD